MKNTEETPTLREAIVHKNPELLDSLLAEGHDPCKRLSWESEDDSVLVLAINQYNNASLKENQIRADTLKIIHSLLDHGALNISSLFYAVNTPLGYGSADLINLMVSKGADVNAKDDYSASPIKYAVENGNAEAVKTLLNHKATIDSQYFFIITHITHFSTRTKREKYLEILNVLKKQKADLNVVSEKGTTPLMQAVLCREPEIVEWFLDNKANPNIADREGKTALMYLAQHEEGMAPAFVPLLKAAGAYLNLEDNEGKSAWYHAAEHNKPELLARLKINGAQPSVYNFVMMQANAEHSPADKLKTMQKIIMKHTQVRSLLTEGFNNDNTRFQEEMNRLKREVESQSRGTGSMISISRRSLGERMTESFSSCFSGNSNNPR